MSVRPFSFLLLAGALAFPACAPAPARHRNPADPEAPTPAALRPVDNAPLADAATWERWKSADYIALAPRAFIPALAPLVAHREAQGHVVATLAVEDLFTRFSSGKADSRALREAVGRLAKQSDGKLRFVLLVGDARQPDPDEGEVASVPTFYEPKLGYENEPPVEPFAFPGDPRALKYPTDRPYGMLDGPAGAKSPLAVGRVPARTASEVAGFVQKTIAYETGRSPGVWPRRLALFAGPANFGPVADRLIESTAFHLLEDEVSYDYDIDVTFAKIESPYAYRFDRLRDKLVADLGQGALIAAYVGHGSYWSFDDVSFRDKWYDIGTSEDAARLRIPSGKPFFLSFTCNTGAFDLPEGRRSIAELLVLNPDGPIAVFAASRESHPYTNALYAAAVVEQFMSARAPTIGEGLIAVRREVRKSSITLAELLVSNDIDALKDEHEGLYNLFGDPASRLRYPENASVSLRSDDGGSTTAHPGSKVDVEVTSEKVPAGRVILTLETLRSAIRAKLVSPAAMEGMRADTALATMAENHKKAIDKIVVRREADLVAGKAKFQITMPREQGKYVIKAFVGAPDGAAAAHARIEVARAATAGAKSR